MWGDSETNDFNFLNSLVRSSSKNGFKHLSLNAINRLGNVLWDVKAIVLSNTLILFLGFMVCFQRKNKGFKLLLFHLFFYVLLLMVSYKVKIVERGITPMFLMLNCLYTLYFLSQFQFKKLVFGLLFFIPFSFFSFLSIDNLIQSNLVQNKAQESYRSEYEKLKILTENKKVFLSSNAFDFYFQTTKAFAPIDYEKYESVYLFNALAISSIEPYRSFLIDEFKCSPNAYKQFFETLFQDEQECLFLMDEEFKLFLESYLLGVHNLDLLFEQVNKSMFLNEVNVYRLTNNVMLDS